MASVATRAMSLGVWVAIRASAWGACGATRPCRHEKADPERRVGVRAGGLLGWTDLGCREDMRWRQRWMDGKLRRLRRGVARRSLTRLPPARSVGGRGSRLYEPRGVSNSPNLDGFAPSLGGFLDFRGRLCVESGCP